MAVMCLKNCCRQRCRRLTSRYALRIHSAYALLLLGVFNAIFGPVMQLVEMLVGARRFATRRNELVGNDFYE